MKAALSVSRCTDVRFHTSNFADQELKHLALVTAFLEHNLEAMASSPLDCAYWHRRIDQICASYELLPVQRLKVALLRRMLDRKR